MRLFYMSGNITLYPKEYFRKCFYLLIMKPTLLFFAFALMLSVVSKAQQIRRQLPAIRTNAIFKIDGNLSEPARKDAVPATDFIEVRPKNGGPERKGNNAVFYIFY